MNERGRKSTDFLNTNNTLIDFFDARHETPGRETLQNLNLTEAKTSIGRRV